MSVKPLGNTINKGKKAPFCCLQSYVTNLLQNFEVVNNGKFVNIPKMTKNGQKRPLFTKNRLRDFCNRILQQIQSN